MNLSRKKIKKLLKVKNQTKRKCRMKKGNKRVNVRTKKSNNGINIRTKTLKRSHQKGGDGTSHFAYNFIKGAGGEGQQAPNISARPDIPLLDIKTEMVNYLELFNDVVNYTDDAKFKEWRPSKSTVNNFFTVLYGDRHSNGGLIKMFDDTINEWNKLLDLKSINLEEEQEAINNIIEASKFSAVGAVIPQAVLVGDRAAAAAAASTAATSAAAGAAARAVTAATSAPAPATAATVAPASVTAAAAAPSTSPSAPVTAATAAAAAAAPSTSTAATSAPSTSTAATSAAAGAAATAVTAATSAPVSSPSAPVTAATAAAATVAPVSSPSAPVTAATAAALPSIKAKKLEINDMVTKLKTKITEIFTQLLEADKRYAAQETYEKIKAMADAAYNEANQFMSSNQPVVVRSLRGGGGNLDYEKMLQYIYSQILSHFSTEAKDVYVKTVSEIPIYLNLLFNIGEGVAEGSSASSVMAATAGQSSHTATKAELIGIHSRTTNMFLIILAQFLDTTYIKKSIMEMRKAKYKYLGYSDEFINKMGEWSGYDITDKDIVAAAAAAGAPLLGASAHAQLGGRLRTVLKLFKEAEKGFTPPTQTERLQAKREFMEKMHHFVQKVNTAIQKTFVSFVKFHELYEKQKSAFETEYSEKRKGVVFKFDPEEEEKKTQKNIVSFLSTLVAHRKLRGASFDSFKKVYYYVYSVISKPAAPLTEYLERITELNTVEQTISRREKQLSTTTLTYNKVKGKDVAAPSSAGMTDAGKELAKLKKMNVMRDEQNTSYIKQIGELTSSLAALKAGVTVRLQGEKIVITEPAGDVEPSFQDFSDWLNNKEVKQLLDKLAKLSDLFGEEQEGPNRPLVKAAEAQHFISDIVASIQLLQDVFPGKKHSVDEEEEEGAEGQQDEDGGASSPSPPPSPPPPLPPTLPQQQQQQQQQQEQ